MLFLRVGYDKDVAHVNLNIFPQHIAAPTLSRRGCTAGTVVYERRPPKHSLDVTHQERKYAGKPKYTLAELIPPGTLKEVWNYPPPGSGTNGRRWSSPAWRRSVSRASHPRAGLREEGAGRSPACWRLARQILTNRQVPSAFRARMIDAA
jgi:hypothetical protein